MLHKGNSLLHTTRGYNANIFITSHNQASLHSFDAYPKSLTSRLYRFLTVTSVACAALNEEQETYIDLKGKYYLLTTNTHREWLDVCSYGVLCIDVLDVEKWDRYRLHCGHEGRVVWVAPDGTSFWVQGRNRRCALCGKGSSGNWTPTVYCFTL